MRRRHEPAQARPRTRMRSRLDLSATAVRAEFNLDRETAAWLFAALDPVPEGAMPVWWPDGNMLSGRPIFAIGDRQRYITPWPPADL